MRSTNVLLHGVAPVVWMMQPSRLIEKMTATPTPMVMTTTQTKAATAAVLVAVAATLMIPSH